ncbi:MAG: sigma-54 dependent transcriptional regulator [Nitrospinota bacterium]|nr:sigma-54 dependent transcriptional regulator [Nitrospinota bacterium]
MKPILVVDDEKSMRDFLDIFLKQEGYRVRCVSSGKDAFEILEKKEFDLVITDIKMPDISGVEVLKKVNSLNLNTPVIMITAFASNETALEALNQGVYDYISKPFNVDEMRIIIKRAFEKKRLLDENAYLKTELEERYQYSQILGKSEKIKKIFKLIDEIADGNSTISILGESGTGKELVARAIHSRSSRKNNPFIYISCGAIEENLLLSELFGHKKGAFTGAISDKKGLLEEADGGTFFLDEIGEAPPAFQVKLLRVLQDKEFKRVGDTKNIKVDVRFISATNKNLLELTKKGLFREDLYYRLHVMPVELPPLRERKEDIPILAEGFLKRFSGNNKRNIKGFNPGTMEFLERFDWPGNVRELENVIERAVALESSDMVQIKSLPESVTTFDGVSELRMPKLSDDGIDLEEYVEKIEKELITMALNRTNGVLNKAASLLNLSFRSFRYRLQKYNIKNIKEELGSRS